MLWCHMNRTRSCQSSISELIAEFGQCYKELLGNLHQIFILQESSFDVYWFKVLVINWLLWTTMFSVSFNAVGGSFSKVFILSSSLNWSLIVFFWKATHQTERNFLFLFFTVLWILSSWFFNSFGFAYSKHKWLFL